MSKLTSEKLVNHGKLQKLGKRLFMFKSEWSITVSLWATKNVHVYNSFFPVLHTLIGKTSPVNSTGNFSQINVKLYRCCKPRMYPSNFNIAILWSWQFITISDTFCLKYLDFWVSHKFFVSHCESIFHQNTLTVTEKKINVKLVYSFVF